MTKYSMREPLAYKPEPCIHGRVEVEGTDEAHLNATWLWLHSKRRRTYINMA